ncbi:hypothetical protein ABL78_0405 [Leptomonas seymouri]|uniref:Uncharacterized protein n=1 Tax=Leptomonas seymouri TaxID=5684 RepID=A0A0N1PFB7_LEPSE|nr:hypothetical protein ABL78_0405 [Leptomonas seymouri]|eukprot:KPI90475.1 hypothetical protein ABL78_0405 [Leptomonas seymouri]
MESSAKVHLVGSRDVQVEVVTVEGLPVTAHPIRVEELLQQQDHTLDIGDGIALRLEELNAQQDYSEDDDSEDADTSSFNSNSSSDDGGADVGGVEHNQKLAASSSRRRVGAPPGTHATNDWYDVLDALRREQQDVERVAAEVEESRRRPQEGEGRLVTQNPHSRRSVATPLKRFPHLHSTETESIAIERSTAPAPGASRREVWASLAPPKDTVPHNYNVLRYVSYMSALDYHRFRPTALAFHAAASYLNRKDRGQRFLVYGGLSFGARKVEHELYEFSVLTGNWRRVEGKQLVPAGHYGHTLTVVEPLDRVVVVGGIGPGGAAVPSGVLKTWSEDPLRAPRYKFLCPLLRRGSGLVSGALGIGATACPAAPQAATPSIGFVSLLFDMNLSDLTWRAIQPAKPFPLAYHTALHFEKEIFIFGGLTEELRVSGQLLVINTETYAVRLIATASAAGQTRSRQDSSKQKNGAAKGVEAEDTPAAATNTAEEEAAGPGPRFLHTAVRYGPYMIIYGGFNSHNEVLSDCWAFDTVNERWERLQCRGEAAGRAGHECCVTGCRMVVVGGFECSLEEAGTDAVAPATTVMELNLSPTSQGEHLWRAAVKLHPALPPLAFTRCAPCGEDHSFLLFGGLTRLPRRSRSKSASKRSGSAKRRIGGADSEDSSAEDADDSQQEAQHGGPPAQHQGAYTAHRAGHKGFLMRLAPFDDGLVFTFPLRHRHKKRDEGEPVVNALGVEVDPNELPEHFKAFVRRQEDFVKKKDAAAADTMRKITVEEQEGMEPTLYLTEDEIELLLQKSEGCCVAFSERYSMSSLPSNVPDREERVKLIEECISESRQMRDVLKSMKGSAPGVTAVKSKSHRKRAGRKFEDYSAAKPFRRVVVVHLIESINTHLARIHRLNKALRTVDWEGKASFLEAVNDMQNSVHAVSRAINGVMRKYITHRVDSLMKGVDKHKEVMRLLTQVVEKNRHDKIWGVEEARDEERHQNQRAGAANRRTASAAAPSLPKGRPKSQRRSASHTAATHARLSRHRSLGGGYHADESKASVYLLDKEWSELLARTQAVGRCAKQLQQYCREGISITATADTPAKAAAPPVALGGGPLSLPLPQVGAAPPAVLPQPPLPPPQLAASQTHTTQTGIPLPVPFAPSAVPASSLLPPTTAIVPAVAATEVGAARPRDILIRHSNELRAKTAAVAEEVDAAAAAFYTALSQQDSGKDTVERQSGTPLRPTSKPAEHLATEGVPSPPPVNNGNNLPPPRLLPPPAMLMQGTDKAARASSGSSCSSASSTSISGSSSLTPAAAAAPTQNAVQPQVPAIPALGLLPPPPATAGIGFPEQTHTPQSGSAIASSPKVKKVVERTGNNPKAEAASTPTPAVSTGHALYLSSLRPLLAAKDALTAIKGQVSLIRKNEWDGNDLAGAPQAVQVEELYRRLVMLITAVAQSVTACFLTKAGARPARMRPASTSVAAPPVPQRAKSKKAEKATGTGPATSATARLSSSPASPQAAQPAASAPKRDADCGGVGPSASTASVVQAPRGHAGDSGVPGAAEVLRLRPPPMAAGGDDWWRIDPPRGGGSAQRRPAEAATPLVPAEALLRDVRLDNVSPPEATTPARLSIQPVFEGVRTVPNTDAALMAASAACGDGFSGGPWSLAPVRPLQQSAGSCASATATSLQQQPAVVSLSVVPKVIMPSSALDANTNDKHAAESNWAYERDGGVSPSHLQRQRRCSTIEELTQLPNSAFPMGAVGGVSGMSGGSDWRVGAVACEPTTSITSGNFAVNTEYLYRVAPHTIPVDPTHGSAADTTADAMGLYNSGAVVGAGHSWADVDDDYFYFGRPAEECVASADTIVGGPPYVAVGPSLRTGRVGVSPPVGSVRGAQRVAAEPSTARRPSATRRSISGRRNGDGYRSTTASQTQKAQTARPVRRDGAGAKGFYTPGELQLMQARERLRSKPQKHSQ